MLKISIVINVYQSYEIVRRQIEYFKKMSLPDSVEFIIVDDYSTPPITGEMRNLRILRTENKKAWTMGLARNLGASQAKGEYLFMTDIDHIISREAIEDALSFTGNKMIFRRQIGVLLEDGTLTQDRDVLLEWGWRGDKLDASVHGNTWVMKKSVFDQLGGYDEKTCLLGYHPRRRGGEDVYFNSKWNKTFAGSELVVGRDIYMFPISRFHKDIEMNPKGFFHNLSTKQEEQWKQS